MQNIPKIVSDRLRVTAPLVNHPDADVLTAFAERSLIDRERATVLDHLSRCHDCRDIVALALPETDAAQLVVRPVRAGWLAWPTLRWGIVAAGVVIVAALGLVEYQRMTRPNAMVAKESEPISTYSQPQAPATAAVPANSREKALPDGATSAIATSDKPLVLRMPAPGSMRKFETRQQVDPGLTASARALSHIPKSNGGAGGTAYGPNIPTQWQQAQVAKQQNAPTNFNLKTPSATQTLATTNGVSATVPDENAANQTDTLAQNQVPLPSQPSAQLFGEDNSHEIARAKPAGNAMQHAAVESIPRWAITAAGGLQRSFDQGNTWQDVNVTANLSAAATSYGFIASTARAAETKQKDLDNKKIASAPIPTPVFRAVAANGPDVWAGGSSGALYHSLDAGNHWTQVVPSLAGATLTGDVIVLEFSDTLHGKVTTSTAEVWSTADDGQTWQRQ